MDEILKNNEETTRLLREEKERSVKAQGDLVEARTKIKELMGKIREIEFQKSADDANIEGLKGIKNELETQVIKDKEIIKNMKLDLLSEKWLRRNLQLEMRELKPDDETFNIDSIDESEYVDKPSTAANGSTTTETVSSTSFFQPFWKMSTEIKVDVKDKIAKKPREHLIPNKIQKSNNLNHHKKNQTLWTTENKKPLGFDFSIQPQPSTSILNFGEPSTSTGFKSLVAPKLGFSKTSTMTLANENNNETRSFNFTPLASLTSHPTSEFGSIRSFGESFTDLANSNRFNTLSPTPSTSSSINNSQGNNRISFGLNSFSFGSPRNPSESTKSSTSATNQGPKASER